MVLVYSDDKNLSFEMLAKGREIADGLEKKLAAVILGGNPDEYVHRGADVVFIVENDPSGFKAEEKAQMLAAAVEKTGAETVLIGSSKDGRELAPRLAAMLDAGCITECTNLYLDNGSLCAERMVYSGNAVAVERFTSRFKVVTVPSKLFDPLPVDTGRKGEIIRENLDVKPAASKVVDVKKKECEGVNVEDASSIVACGRGLKNKEDLAMVEELAKLLPGEAVGCSRPLSADLKWLSEDHWVGLSGHKVKPKLYIALGISGQIQHIAGMRDSDIVVAINKDPEALIFKAADYGIVGDMYQVVPKLVKAIREKKGVAV